jgi:hypothetical protein
MNNNIPFIHNYCDRWCERCYFTRNCAVFFEVEGLSEEEKDMNNKAFWDRLSEDFKNSLQSLQDSAKKFGFDPDDITEEDMADAKKQIELIDSLVRKNPLSDYCRQYWKLVKKLLEDEEYWKSKADDLIIDLKLGVLNDMQAKEKAEEIKECQDVLGWYMFFIEVKFKRALSGKIEDDDFKTLQCDANGSAKVALLAVERSLHACGKLFGLLKDEDRYLPVLSLLSKIERAALNEFPNAMLFIRPGFDEQ